MLQLTRVHGLHNISRSIIGPSQRMRLRTTQHLHALLRWIRSRRTTCKNSFAVNHDMDPLSITASCVGLTAAITKTSIALTKFVRDVRDARADIDGVSRELGSLSTVLQLLKEDTAKKTTPATLEKQVIGIIENCKQVIVEIDGTLAKYEGSSTKKAARWAAIGRDDINKSRSSLEAHKSALDIALSMVEMWVLSLT